MTASPPWNGQQYQTARPPHFGLHEFVQQNRVGEIGPPPVIGKDKQVRTLDIIAQDLTLRRTVKDRPLAHQKVDQPGIKTDVYRSKHQWHLPQGIGRREGHRLARFGQQVKLAKVGRFERTHPPPDHLVRLVRQFRPDDAWNDDQLAVNLRLRGQRANRQDKCKKELQYPICHEKTPAA
ncbi:hypothetical protein ACFQFQ_18125 [Sulfitobacter porphyrae]|uniref:Uncharacterized protein n=1 Tax=Sulfitobacter porphyrae TaxID=1246864 RepID=A0ABW2B6E3_9RHOB